MENQYPLNGDVKFPIMNFGNGFSQQSGYQMMSSFQCEYCSKMFVHKESFERHVLCHDVEKITGGSQDLRQSESSASNVNMVPSDTTVKVSATRTVKPQRKVTPVSSVPQCRPKLHACDECPKSYTRKDHLQRHKLWHIGDRPHVCSVCFKAFIRKDKLVRHEKIHVRDTICNCSICGKDFLRKDALNKHMRTHEKKLNMSCKKTTNSSQQTDDFSAMNDIYDSHTKSQSFIDTKVEN